MSKEKKHCDASWFYFTIITVEYKYLKAFLLTAKYSSFSRAAAELRIAQSAVSRQIKLLEETLKQQLIIRSPKQVILTSKGQELYLAATDFDKSVNSLFTEDNRKEIRVGVLHGVLETWLISFMRRYYKIRDANIVIQVDKPHVLIEGLTNRNLDLAITNEFLQTEMISSLKLFDEELVVVSKKKVDYEELAAERWITYDNNDWLHVLFKKRQSERYLRVNSMTAIVNLVRNDLGVAIVPTHMLSPSDDDLFRIPIPKAKNPSIYISTLNYAHMPHHIREVSDLLRQLAEGAQVTPGGVAAPSRGGPPK